jgi:hypothetical protein
VKQSRLTYVIHAQNVPDKGRLFSHLVALNPVAIVVLDEPGIARELKDRLPNTNVIFRYNGNLGKSAGDGDLHNKYLPEEWLDAMLARIGGDTRIMLHTTNEPGLSRRLIKWHEDLIPLANARGVSLCVINLATGNPEPEKRNPNTGAIEQESQWEIAEPLLKLLAVHRQHILGLHEYFGAVPTSGMITRLPTLIMPGEWPAKAIFPCYHLGRFKFLLEYCNRHNIKHPRIGLTEHSADDTSDIKTDYLDKLKKTPPFPNIRGYKTLRNQWQDWYGAMGWTLGRTLGEMLAWADTAIYQGSPVEFQSVFSYGNSGGWESFDTADDTDYQQFIIQYAQTTPEQPPVLYPALPTPLDTRWQLYSLTGDDNYFIRPAPSTLDVDLTTKIRAGELFSYIPDVEYVNEGVTWIQVKNSAGNVGWASKEVLTVIPGLPPPVDPPPPPYTPDEEARKLVDIWRGLLIKKQHEVGKINAEITAIKWTIAKLETGMIEELDERPDAA